MMPALALDPSVQLDQPQSGTAVRLPDDAKLDEPPHTTAGGLAASFARGAAPIATGALIGAGLGAPFAGIGAVPGAIAGMGIAGATELGEDAYNLIARHRTGMSPIPTLSESTDKALDKVGLKRPGTPAEQMAETVGGIAPFGVSSVATLGEAVAKDSVAGVERYIKDTYQRAIKPSSAGINTPGQLSDYDRDVASAIHTIVANKSRLRFVDHEGHEVEGELPKSIEQFSDAIEQGKQILFAQYDQMARAAGDAGATVDLHPAIGELNRVADDPVVKDLHPQTAGYARDRAASLTERGQYSTVDAQRAVQNLNASLKAFYSNPSYDTASKAAIDSMIANQLRRGLDNAVEDATAPGYQELKNRYGALKAIERDVVKRQVVSSRQNRGGGLMGNIGDIASAEEIIRGIVTLSPLAVARGVTLKGVTKVIQHLRDPNRAIEKMFQAAEKLHRPEPDQPIAGYLEPPPVRGGPGPWPPEPGQLSLPRPPSQEPGRALLPPPSRTGGPAPWVPTESGIIPPESPGFTVSWPNGK